MFFLFIAKIFSKKKEKLKVRKKILGVAGLSALALLGLASCGNGVHIGQVDNKEIENLKDVIKENYEYEKSEEVKVVKDDKDSLTKTAYTAIDDTKYTMLNTYNLGEDLSVVKNEKDYYGIWSLVEGKFLVKPMYYKDFVNSINKTTISGLTYIAVQYGGKYDYYDEYGNVIAKNQKTAINNLTKQTPTVDDGYYFKTKIDDEVKYLQYKYSDNGKLTILDEMPKDKDKQEFKKDDLYFTNAEKIKHEDKEYTLKYMNNASNSYINVYDSDNKLFKSFEIPYAVDGAANVIAFDNGNTIVQVVNRLPDDAKDYSYSSGTEKYKLTSLKANIFEDKGFSEVNLGYRITQTKKRIVDKDGKCKYAEVTVKSILSDYVLGPSRYYIYTDELKLGNEMTYDLSGMAMVGDGYYNSNARILYDADLNVVTYSVTGYVKELDAFVFEYDGYKGVVDTTGKVIVPFEYTAINTNKVINNKVYATNKKGDKGILDVKNNTFTTLKGYDGQDASLYMKENDTTVEFVNLGGSITLTGSWTSIASKTNLFSSKFALLRTDVTTTNPETCTLLVNDGYFNENGTEVTTDFTSNSAIVNATTLTVGDNKNVQMYGIEGSYFKITGEANKRLVIKTETELDQTFRVYDSEGTYLGLRSFSGHSEIEKAGVTTHEYYYDFENAATYFVRLIRYYDNRNIFTDFNISFTAIPENA